MQHSSRLEQAEIQEQSPEKLSMGFQKEGKKVFKNLGAEAVVGMVSANLWFLSRCGGAQSLMTTIEMKQLHILMLVALTFETYR